VWYELAGTTNGQEITASLCGSSFDTFIRVFDACGGTEIASNDDDCGTRSQVTFVSDGLTTYYIMVEGFSSNNGDFDLAITCVAPCVPAIVDTTTITDDCANSQFSVQVDFTSVGDATGVSDGTTTYAISGTTATAGPFATTDTVTLSVIHSDSDCDFAIPGTFEFNTCPTILLSETVISNLVYEDGNGPSTNETFTVEGSNLTTGITLTTPPGFEISTDENGISPIFGNSLTLPQTMGTVSSTTIYVRLAEGLGINTYTGTLSATSAPAGQQDITLNGEVTVLGGTTCTSIFSDDFSGTLGQWDFINDWTISSGELKHDLSGTAGNSFINADITTQDLSTADYEWEVCIRNGSWDPSGGNKFSYFFLSSQLNLASSGTGYAVGVNMNGTNDLLSLYSVNSGMYTSIVESSFDWNSNDDVCIRVTRSSTGDWELFYSDNGSGEISAGTTTNTDFTTGNYIGAYFEYTSSRAGLLWLDDVNICKTGVSPTTELQLVDAQSNTQDCGALTLDYGIVAPTTSSDLTFDITNTGSLSLDVTDLSITGTDFTIISPSLPTAMTPLTIAPSGSETITVRYTANTTLGSTNGTLTITNTDDDEGLCTVNLTGISNVGPDLIITEVSDPGDDSDGKFVEIYNNGITAIDLAAEQIHIAIQFNGGNIFSRALTGILEPDDILIIGNSININGIFGFNTDEDYGSIDGNGNDGYYLYFGGDENTGNLLDAYGVLGVDGTGEAWEYEDSRAFRNNPKLTSPNDTWTASEWTIIPSSENIDATPGALENEFRYDNVWKPRDAFVNATTTDHIIIISDLLADNDLTAGSMEIRPSQVYTVGAGFFVDVLNAIDNNGEIVLQSTSSTYASLVVNTSTTVNGTVKYERFVNSNDNGNDLIAPPLAGQDWSSFLTDNASTLFDDDNTSPTTYLFGPFDKASSSYVNYTDATTTTLTSGIGYRAASDSGSNLTFTGDVPTGDVDVAIENSGSSFAKWNLVGNPYPAYLKVREFLELDVAPGVSNLDLFESGLAAAIYGYDGNATDGWVTFNLANTTLDTRIAPGQGFFVSADGINSAVYDLRFTPSMSASATIDNEDDFIAGRNAELVYLKLNASTTDKSYQTQFYFNPNASLGLDIGYDAEVWGGTAPSFALYSHLVQDNTGIPIGLQTMHSADLSDVTIPLGVNATQGEQLTFSISDSTLPSNIEVYLEDTFANTFTLLNTTDYVIVPNANLSGTGRFFLRTTEDTLSTSENQLETLSIYTNSQDKTIVIAGSVAEGARAILYDIQGRMISQRSLERELSRQTIDVSDFSSGVYVVQLKTGTSMKTQKVIIK
jgi:hypothetical protein